MSKWKAYCALMRFDKPIGTLLLFFPVSWALLLAYASHPPLSMIVLFTLGVILTRTAGCIINDVCDRHIDQQVARTRLRPLASGALTVKEALIALIVLGVCLIGLWFFLNPLARWLGLIAAGLTLLYPLTKRFFAYPQAVLGVTFNMGVLMVFAQAGELTQEAWWLYAASVVWTFTYDTVYAMADQKDDERIGVRSSALSLGKHVHVAIGAGYALMSVLLALALGQALFIGILGAAISMGLYVLLCKRWITEAPLTFFKANAVLGMMVIITFY